ncbi:MAG: CpcT/CpeT family chromophore lyase [Phycisphaerales bacterium]
MIRLRFALVLTAGLALTTAPSLGQSEKVDSQPTNDAAVPPAAPTPDLTPRFGPRGLRIRPPAGAEFGAGNVLPGAFDVPGWPAAKAERPLPEIGDKEIAAAVEMLSGSFATGSAKGEIPALVMGMGRVDVPGFDNAVYFEIARADSPSRPYRQGILHFYRTGGASGALKLRLFSLAGAPTLGDAVVGLWLAPEVFPDLNPAALRPIVDITLAKSGAGYTGSSGRFPVQLGSAIEGEISIELAPGRVSLGDRAYDAAGKQVSGLPAGESLVFSTAPSSMRVTKRDDGMFIIDLVPPAGSPAAEAGSDARVAVHFSGWLHTDGWKFASSRDPRWDGAPVEPQLVSLQAKLLSAWTKGLPGVTKGTIRRLIVPSGMAFHNVGSPQWRVPPDTPVIFEIECVWVEDKSAVPPAPAAPEKKPEESKKAEEEAAGTGSTTSGKPGN